MNPSQGLKSLELGFVSALAKTVHSGAENSRLSFTFWFLCFQLVNQLWLKVTSEAKQVSSKDTFVAK